MKFEPTVIPWCAVLFCLALALACGDDDPSSDPADAGNDASTDGADASDDRTDDDRTNDVDTGPSADEMLLMSVPESSRQTLPGLQDEVHVVRTEAGVPHIYASNRLDMARVHGLIFATDRFWMIDLGRRLGRGHLSDLFGDIMLDADITSRSRGFVDTAQRLLDQLEPERRAELEAFTEGINAYIQAARDGELPPPTELEFASLLLGELDPANLMEDLDLLDVLAFATVVLDQSTCAWGEVANDAALAATFTAYEGRPFAGLREAGARDDIIYRLEPLTDTYTVASAQNKDGETSPWQRRGSGLDAVAPLPFPPGFLESVAERLERYRGMGRGVRGSNAWAVSGSHTVDGATLLAGDGHLALAVPAYFHQAGLDTGVLGGDDWHVRGNWVAGLPPLGVGTNGHVAWSFTCYFSDTVDYYREEIRLGSDGLPDATRFDGRWEPIVRIDETYDTAIVLAFQSQGGPITQPRFETFDGRRILSIEGTATENPDEGWNFGDGFVVPGDTDDDGVITALSLDATYLDVGDAIGAYYRLAESENLAEFRDWQRRLAVFGSHFVAADREGSLLATGYHASPCRDGFPRTQDGSRFAAGSDPQFVLDGTRHGAFSLALTDEGYVDDDHPDPASCVVSFDEFPHAVDPPQGYVVSANNDPAGLTADGSLADDDIYIGGPWDLGLRARRITELVAEAAEAGTADVETMARIQADTRSSNGELWSPYLIEVIDRARMLAESTDMLDEAQTRVASLYSDDAERFDEVAGRLEDWANADWPTPSGVETFYHQPAEGDGEMAVATMIYNAWIGHFRNAVLGDERLTGSSRTTNLRATGHTLALLIAGRGDDNPRGLSSWNADTGESIFFDLMDTPQVETSDEMALVALRDALTFLASDEAFGTDDMDEWLWGLLHVVRFESILAPFVGNIEAANIFVEQFGITPNVLPITEEELPESDPRSALVGFPRPGDNDSVDSADPGFRGRRFDYTDGPVKRMVIALHPDGRVSGQNIIPGGQSGLSDSPHYADQVQYWLGNEALPLRFHLDEVVEGAVARDVYTP